MHWHCLRLRAGMVLRLSYSEKRKVVMPPRSMAVLIGEYPERKTTMDVKKKASKNKK